MMLRFMDLERRRRESTSGLKTRTISEARVKSIEALGLTSYPMYLFHGPFMMFVGSLLLRSHLAIDSRLTWAILVASGLLSGLALGWWLERPFMAWRSGWLKSRGARDTKKLAAGLSSVTHPGISSC